MQPAYIVHVDQYADDSQLYFPPPGCVPVEPAPDGATAAQFPHLPPGGDTAPQPIHWLLQRYSRLHQQHLGSPATHQGAADPWDNQGAPSQAAFISHDAACSATLSVASPAVHQVAWWCQYAAHQGPAPACSDYTSGAPGPRPAGAASLQPTPPPSGAAHPECFLSDIPAQPAKPPAAWSHDAISSPEVLYSPSTSNPPAPEEPPLGESARSAFLASFGPDQAAGRCPPAPARHHGTSSAVGRGGRPAAKPKVCSYCSKTFAKSSALRYHQAVRHPSAATAALAARLTCRACAKSFSCPATLRTHARTHTGEQPFACAECGEAFSDRSVWRRHQRVHTGYKPHVCGVCGLDFSQLGNLKRHVITQHPGRADTAGAR